MDGMEGEVKSVSCESQPKAAQGPQTNEKRTTDNAKGKMRRAVARPRAFKYQIAHTANPKSKIENPKSRSPQAAQKLRRKSLKEARRTELKDLTEKIIGCAFGERKVEVKRKVPQLAEG